MTREKDTAKEIIRFLDEGIAKLDARIVGKLNEARHRAVAVLTRQQSAQATSTSGGILHLFNDYIHNHRAMMSTALVCSAVFVAFLVTQQFSRQDNLEQGDGFLLASDLPPEAYLDKGFDVWLERSSRH
jgi:Protein of unknown function (DUF3619)